MVSYLPANKLPSKAVQNISRSYASDRGYEVATKQFGLSLTSGHRGKDHPIEAAKIKAGRQPGDHYGGRAYDFSGSTKKMDAFAQWAKSSGMFKQVIWNGKDLMSGKKISGHTDHVHVSWAEPEAVPIGYKFAGSNGSSQTKTQPVMGYSNYWKIDKEAKAAGAQYSSTANTIKRAMAANNVPSDWFTPLMELVGRESTWDPKTTNSKSSARGLFQFLDSTRRDYGGNKVNWNDPYQQAVKGIQYVKDRYGTPVKALQFWDKNKWY